MKFDAFRDWLSKQGHQTSSIETRVSSLRRVEHFFGDLDGAFDPESRENIFAQFAYSMEDEKDGRPNPSPVPIDGNLREGLASLRQALSLYDEFRNGERATPNRFNHSTWLTKVTQAEILAVMDDIDREGDKEFLRRTGFSKPQQWTTRPDTDGEERQPRLYPCKATVAAAITKLKGGTALNASQYFGGYGEAESRQKLTELGFEVVETSGREFTRDAIEAAMQAYDEFQMTGAHSEIFESFGTPSSYWTCSTLDRQHKRYPTKPIVGFITNRTKLNGGWNPGSAAALLHNAGYLIVDASNSLCDVPDHRHLARGADRIRSVAKNYFFEPARERGQIEITIRAREIAETLGLSDDFPNICQALGGKKFKTMIDAVDIRATEPNPSSTTAFTYQLSPQSDEPHARRPFASGDTDPMNPTNLILHGPPGTGKTYQTASEALRLCGEDVPDNRDDIMAAYNRLRAENRIEFVTFHQSTSYEDFVEGRQPTTEGSEEGSGTGFRLETVPGIFRRISRRAAGATALPSGERAITLEGRQAFKMSIGRAGDPADEHLFTTAIEEGCMLIGWENIDFGDDKFSDPYEILEACRERGTREGEPNLQSGQVNQVHIFRNQVQVGDIIVVSKGNSRFRAIGEVTGEYDYAPADGVRYSHRRAVNWLWVDEDGLPVSEINDKTFSMSSIYKLSADRLKVSALERFMNSGEEHESDRGASLPFVLIIDEINRANISKVFGELITLIEPDKRLGMPNALTVRLPYSVEEFGVPANLHILGTMNTADRSIALLDTALRRRFEFREMLPQPQLKAMRDAGDRCGLDLPEILTVLNERIEYLYDREHQIGHAYFVNCTTREEVDAVMRYKVIPLLAEYFFEDWSKVAAVLGDDTSDEGPLRGGFMNRDVLRAPPGMTDVDDMLRFRWSLREGAFAYDGLIAG